MFLSCISFYWTSFLQHSLRLQKKAFDRTISELEHKANEEEELHKLGKYVREREGIERKLTTTYSLGRDGAGLKPKSLLPLYDGKTRSYSFQGAKRETVTIFHTLSNTDTDTDIDSDSSSPYESSSEYEDKDLQENNETTSKAKGKAPMEVWSSSSSSSDDEEETFENKCRVSPSNSASTSISRGLISPLYLEHQFDEREKGRQNYEGLRKENMLIRRRTLSSTDWPETTSILLGEKTMFLCLLKITVLLETIYLIFVMKKLNFEPFLCS